MKNELFKKVHIKTEADLPKEKGFHFIHWKHPDERIPSQMSIAYFNPETKGIWLDYDWYDWYLQPIEEQECDHPFAFVQSRCFGEINHCLKCGKDL